MAQRTQANHLLRFRSIWIAAGWVLVALIVWLSLTPRPMQVSDGQGDKLGHALAYFVLMLWFAQLYLSGKQRVTLALACLGLGIGLEYAQLLTDTRTFEVADMAADGVGVLVGWLAAPPRGFAFLRLLEDAGSG